MTADTLQRARWAQNGPRSWALKCAVKDGGAVLASIEERGAGYVCEVGGVMWAMGRFYAAQRAARKALREGLRAEPFSLKDAGRA